MGQRKKVNRARSAAVHEGKERDLATIHLINGILDREPVGSSDICTH
jgi:hypothetical protein